MAMTAATISRTIRTCFIVGSSKSRLSLPVYYAPGAFAQEPEIWLCLGVEQTPETFENVADAVAGELEGVCGNVEYAVGCILGDVERAVNNLVGVLGYCSGDVRRDLGGYDLSDDFHHFCVPLVLCTGFTYYVGRRTRGCNQLFEKNFIGPRFAATFHGLLLGFLGEASSGSIGRLGEPLH